MEKKSARGFPQDPKYVADEIKKIIDIMISQMSLEAQQKAYPNLRKKFNELNINEISNKKPVGGSSIGSSISLVKNILNGKDPYFIKSVLDELSWRL